MWYNTTIKGLSNLAVFLNDNKIEQFKVVYIERIHDELFIEILYRMRKQLKLSAAQKKAMKKKCPECKTGRFRPDIDPESNEIYLVCKDCDFTDILT